jgi:hypothetical protein
MAEQRPFATVADVTGLCQYFDKRGQVLSALLD